MPNVPTTPPAPSLTVLSPKSGDTIALTAQVAVAAASVNGISSVSVLCGQMDAGARTVYAWAAEPYLALVDFSLCQGLATPNPDGGLPLLPVAVRALSDAGATQEVDLELQFNAAGPVLSVLYPPSAQPKAPFTVLVASDRPLRSFPQVVLASTAASTVTAVDNPDGGLPAYAAFFASTPGLGTDNAPYTPGVPVPIEVLTDTSQTVRLVVNATALNGNTTQVDLGVELTRVVWDRYIPGQPASSNPISWAAEPVAYDGGLLLPLATASPASATSDWYPGRLAAADGTFSGFNPALLPDAGVYVARGINALGQTLFVEAAGNITPLLFVPPPPATGPLWTNFLIDQGAIAPLTAVDNLLCLQDSVTACSASTTESLTCFTPELTAVTTTSGLAATGPPVAGVVAGAGGSYLSPVNPICGSSWNLVDLFNGTVSFGPLRDPNNPAVCGISAVTKVLPVGDGTFIVQLLSACGSVAVLPPEYPILRVNADGTILGGYTVPFLKPALVQREVVGVLPDGGVVTLTNAPPNTNFELWGMNNTTPDVVTPISGLYDSADAMLGSVLAQSSYASADGSFAVLLTSSSSFGTAIAAFGPSLQPLWLYLYPRISDFSSARLVSAGSVGDVYLVDEFNNRAVSVRVEQPPAPGSCVEGGAVTLSTSTPSAYFCHDAYQASFTVTNRSCSPVTVQSIEISEIITAGPCAPFTPGTYTPTTTTVPAGITTTVFDLVANPFCCANQACPVPVDCTATNAFTVRTSAGVLTSSAIYTISLGGCDVICP